MARWRLSSSIRNRVIDCPHSATKLTGMPFRKAVGVEEGEKTMYCSSCGGAVARGLGYCNHCGSNLNTPKSGVGKPAELFPDSLIWAIVTVFIVGLGGTIGLMAVMKDVFGSSNLGLIIAFSLLILGMMLAVEGVLIWLLFHRKSNAKDLSDIARMKEQTTKELETAPARALPEPLPSVTEHTTRAFDPIYKERKSS